MSVLILTPVILSLLALGAHCLRLGIPGLIVLPLGVLGLLFFRRPWAARIAQVTLLLGGLEWIRSTLAYVSVRQDLGQPWLRLALILGGVSLFTLLSSLVFRSRTLRRRYRLE